MPYRQALRDIKKNKIHPIYVLYGTESFLIEEFLQYMKSEVVDPAVAEFTMQEYDLGEVPLAAVIEDAETMPFMGDRKLVIAKEATFLTGVKVNPLHEASIDDLLRYVQEPSDVSILILIVHADKLDERKKLVKALKERAVVLAFLPLKDEELWSWIEHKLQKLQVEMERAVARELVNWIGTDLRRLHQELKKMALYVGASGQITLDVVERLASRTLEEDVFRLIDLVVRLDRQSALRMYYDLLKNKQDPIAILMLLAGQFRLMLQSKLLLDRGYSQQQIASSIGVHPYRVKLALERARSFSDNGLRTILAQLSEEEYRIKTGKMDKVLAGELVLMRIPEWSTT